MKRRWLSSLCTLVENNPISILLLHSSDYDLSSESRRGMSSFSIARRHSIFEGVAPHTVCLVLASQGRREDSMAFIGIVKSRTSVTTLDTRIKVTNSTPIYPARVSQLINLMTRKSFKSDLKKRLNTPSDLIMLSPQLSRHLVESLANDRHNHPSLQRIFSLLSTPKKYDSIHAMHEDALQSAIKAFGIPTDEEAGSLELFNGRDTPLARINVTEDMVISYDRNNFPSHELVGETITGRALFRNNEEELEIVTANRNDIEHAFGVDLVYINKSRENVVMVQYKMLEQSSNRIGAQDWVYRPDNHVNAQIKKMEYFWSCQAKTGHEYRLNSQSFYMKFVKRNGALRAGGIIMPIDHFKSIINKPEQLGPRGGIRISYASLNGSYLRETAFLDLIRSGYIGAHAADSANYKSLVDEILNGNRALVAAIQRRVKSQ